MEKIPYSLFKLNLEIYGQTLEAIRSEFLRLAELAKNRPSSINYGANDYMVYEDGTMYRYWLEKTPKDDSMLYYVSNLNDESES